MSNPLDWDDLAFNNNFSNDKQMLIHFHHVLNLTLDAIGLRLNMHSASVRKRMKLLNIKVIPPSAKGRISCPRQYSKGV